jgi:hypothetical protein
MVNRLTLDRVAPLVLLLVVGAILIYAYPQHGRLKERQMLLGAFSYGSQAAQQIKHFYLTRERWPEGIDEIGIGSPPALPASVAELELGQGGALTLYLDPQHYPKAEIRFLFFDTGQGVGWRCRASGLEQGLLPDMCRIGEEGV